MLVGALAQLARVLQRRNYVTRGTGFAVHTISSTGNVQTEFVLLPGAKP